LLEIPCRWQEEEMRRMEGVSATDIAR